MSEHEDAITSKNDHKQIVIDQAAVDLSIDKNLAQNTDTELGTDADLSVGETGTVLNEDEFTAEEYKALLRKIDRWLLPLMFCCYGIQQTDKTATGIQAIFGLRTDLSLHGEQYNWLTTMLVAPWRHAKLCRGILVRGTVEIWDHVTKGSHTRNMPTNSTDGWCACHNRDISAQ